MAIIIILIAISLSIALLFLVIFFWTIQSGQYEDTYTPSIRILFDNRPKKIETEIQKPNGGPAHAE